MNSKVRLDGHISGSTCIFGRNPGQAGSKGVTTLTANIRHQEMVIVLFWIMEKSMKESMDEIIRSHNGKDLQFID